MKFIKAALIILFVSIGMTSFVSANTFNNTKTFSGKATSSTDMNEDPGLEVKGQARFYETISDLKGTSIVIEGVIILENGSGKKIRFRGVYNSLTSFFKIVFDDYVNITGPNTTTFTAETVSYDGDSLSAKDASGDTFEITFD